MSIEQTNVIDAISVNESTDDVVLTISDHLEWTGGEHLYLLQEKINAYLSFVESGEILKSYEKAKGRAVLIELVCKYLPDDESVRFLTKVKEVTEGAGIKFNYRGI